MPMAAAGAQSLIHGGPGVQGGMGGMGGGSSAGNHMLSGNGQGGVLDPQVCAAHCCVAPLVSHCGGQQKAAELFGSPDPWGCSHCACTPHLCITHLPRPAPPPSTPVQQLTGMPYGMPYGNGGMHGFFGAGGVN